MVVQHNLLAMNSNRMLNITSKKQAKSTEKLSSGYKINRAADDAAGLSISEKMRRQIRGLTQGVQNTQDGVSLCQVADGALAEVNDMLHRITELSVKASNGTLSQDDREAIQKEINQIVVEIDRIADTTKFNERFVFKGRDEVVYKADGTPALTDPVGFNDITLSALTLIDNPFSVGEENIQAFGVAAKVVKPGHADNGTTYKLAFGNNNTVGLRVNDVDQSSFSYVPGSMNETAGVVSRKFTSGDIEITQKIKIVNDTNDKKYEVTYEFENKGASTVDLDFFFNVDTAYNNNDHNDNYYINGTLLERGAVYKGANATVGNIATNVNVISGIPDSLSLVDQAGSMAFSQKMSWTAANTPDAVTVGAFETIRHWSAYDDSTINSIVSQSTAAKNPGRTTDLGYTLMWNDKSVDAGGKWSVSFYTGVSDVRYDGNLTGTGIQPPAPEEVLRHVKDPIWIQSGADAHDGMFIEIDELSSEIIGIKDADVTTQEKALETLDATGEALRKLSSSRSKIGAYQNRLEHTIANEENVIENTTAAESAIRDTDMATEMVRYSNNNILAQAGQAMLAQANQTNQAVLSLLQG